ncbi:MAG TPA: hypothetical protein VKP65_21270 [Rhodothermales bacterium]|nr:hypothetical protein [Rhodothermales bacterium]
MVGPPADQARLAGVSGAWAGVGLAHGAFGVLAAGAGMWGLSQFFDGVELVVGAAVQGDVVFCVSGLEGPGYAVMKFQFRA